MSKWEENLKKVSESNDIDKMHQEWAYIGRATRELRDGHCICGRAHIKHVNFFCNIKNKNMIEVGGGCIKKLRLETLNSAVSRAHNTLLRKFNKLGHPIKDIDIKVYLQMVFDHFNEKIDFCKNNMFKLKKIYRQILSAMDMKLYNNDLMNKLLKKIINIINELEEREAAKLKKEEEQREKEAAEAKEKMERWNQMYKEEADRTSRNNKLRRENKEKLCQLNFGKYKKRTYIDVLNNDYEYIEWLNINQSTIIVSWECEKFLSWVENYPVRVIQKGLKYKIEKIREKIRKEQEEKRQLEEKIRKEQEEKRELEEKIRKEKEEKRKKEKREWELKKNDPYKIGTFIGEKFIATRPASFDILAELETYNYFNKIKGGKHCEYNRSYKQILTQYMN